MNRSRVALIVLAFGLAGFLLGLHLPHAIRLAGVPVGDVGPPLAGMMQFLRDLSPYSIRLQLGATALYPFTTIVMVSPLLIVPLPYVAPVFCGLSSALLALSVLQGGRPWQLLIFLSPAYWNAMMGVQFSPLVTAGLLLPALLPLAIIKPQMVLVAAAAGRWSKRSVLVVALIVLLSLILLPSWPFLWLDQGQLSTYQANIPLLTIPGVLLAGSLLAIRRWQARLLLALSLTPQRYFYDQLPLLLVAESPVQLLGLLVTSWIIFAAAWLTNVWTPFSGVQDPRVWTGVIVLQFLPALGCVLWNHFRGASEPAGAADGGS